MARIRLREHGPLVIEDDSVTIVDWQGQPYDLSGIRKPVALCRCGHSANKPFCDGSHKRCAFDGGPPATARTADDDATPGS